MAAHQPHRLPRRRAHRRRAEPLGKPAERALRRLAGLDHPRRHAERPGRGVDQEGRGFGLVVDEVAFAELVLDEAVGGAGVGHAQQRLRQHHQRQALLGRERELAQHVLDAAERVVIVCGSPRSAASRSGRSAAPARRERERARGLRAMAPSSGAKGAEWRNGANQMSWHAVTGIPRAPYHAAGLLNRETATMIFAGISGESGGGGGG